MHYTLAAAEATKTPLGLVIFGVIAFTLVTSLIALVLFRSALKMRAPEDPDDALSKIEKIEVILTMVLLSLFEILLIAIAVWFYYK